jgi:hypothetical protein
MPRQQRLVGEKFVTVPVNKHKTGMQFLARVTLNESLVSFIEDYIKYVRDPIVRKSDSKAHNLLIQYDGDAFLRVAQGLMKAQERMKTRPTVTIGDVRKSIETSSKKNVPSATEGCRRLFVSFRRYP